tara:strand:+ start:61 stop:357 length:297 start_codon:yes stop_codon:yes gene_type:complete
MIRYPSIILIFFILFAGISIYELKSMQLQKEKIILNLENKIRKKNERIKLLKAELSYLSRPQRIEKIATELLNMKTILPIDIWNINDLSMIKKIGSKK